MQGKSWRPLLERKSSTPVADWRKAFFYEYFHERNFAVPTLFAVRTDSAKLIKYKDHDEWTELFNLTKDPYELHNLRHDNSSATLSKNMDAEYDRQKDAVAFAYPEYDSDTEEVKTVASANEWVLDYRFNKDTESQAVDASGKGNNGRMQSVALAEGREGKKARRFDGSACIQVPKSLSLNPMGKTWVIEAVFKSETPNGIVLAQGGENFGYCLAVRDGHPIFVVTGARTPSEVMLNQNVVGKWVTIRATIVPDAVLLSLDAATPVRETLKAPITRNPTEPLQIGDDLGSVVIPGKKLPSFNGLIESVRIHDGALP
jgi:hypothetical protein